MSDVARVALKERKLEVLNDDELLELGGEMTANGGADASLPELEAVYAELKSRIRE